MCRPPVESEAAQLTTEGGRLYFAEHLEEARACFIAARENDPSNAMIHRWIAEVEWRLGHWGSAMAACQSALKLDETICFRFYDWIDIRKDTCTHETAKPPIFIVGCGHSGTSLLLAILGYHREIFAIPYESALFTQSDSAACALMREWDSDCHRAGKSRWVEKTPLHVLQIGRWLKLRPKAKIILVVRDGRDVVASLKRRPEWQDIQRRIDRWLCDNLAGLQYRDHPQVMTLRYEDFVSDPESMVSKVCKFLGEAYYYQLLDYHEEQRLWYASELLEPKGEFKHTSHDDHMNLRNWQINQPIFDGRGAWRRTLDADEITHMKNSRMQSLLERLGYVADKKW